MIVIWSNIVIKIQDMNTFIGFMFLFTLNSLNLKMYQSDVPVFVAMILRTYYQI